MILKHQMYTTEPSKEHAVGELMSHARLAVEALITASGNNVCCNEGFPYSNGKVYRTRCNATLNVETSEGDI